MRTIFRFFDLFDRTFVSSLWRSGANSSSGCKEIFGAWSAALVKCSNSQYDPCFSLMRSECISSSNCSRSLAREEILDVACFFDSKSCWLDRCSEVLNWTTVICFSFCFRFVWLLRLDLDLDLKGCSDLTFYSLPLPLESFRFPDFVSAVLVPACSYFLIGITRFVVAFEMFSFCCYFVRLLCWRESMYSILLWFTRCSLPRPFIWERSFSTSTSRLTNLLSGLFSRSIVVGILLRHFFVTFSIRLTSNATSSLSYPIESSILYIFAFKGESCFWIYSLIWLSKSENCSCIWVLNSVSFS